jgi:hypothetical protein
MAQQNGGGASTGTPEIITQGVEHAPSLDGFTGAPPEGAFEERPELLVGVAFAAGVLLGGLVSRIGR